MYKERLSLLITMGVFGTISLLVRNIPLPSGTISLFRSALAVVFLIAFALLRRRKPDVRAMGKKKWHLLLSGAMMAFNWVLLFEAYRYTTVATATVCYYMAPILLVLCSPFLGERLTLPKVLGIAMALAGLVGISGILEQGIPALSELAGIGLGLGAAVLYAGVMLTNKFMPEVNASDRTTCQMAVAAAVLLPYVLFTGIGELGQMTATGWVLLAVLGLVHTGIAYTVYFSAIGKLPVQTTAVLSYFDPAVGVAISWTVLQEKAGPAAVIGTVLILAGASLSEWPTKK